jgi:hypothetical protein
VPVRTFARGCLTAVLLLTLVAGTARAEDDPPPPGPQDQSQSLLDALARLLDVEGDLELLVRVGLLWDPRLVALVQASQRQAQTELGEAIARVRREGTVPARPDRGELLDDFDELKEQARRLKARAEEAERTGDSGSATRLRDEAATADLGASGR